jgi:luciferase family oxidoreductase group 1
MPGRALPYSILDLAPILRESDASQTFRNTVALAQQAERLGFRRYWLAEHHNMPGVASAATAVVIGHVAGATSTIRVGSGGIMLPNHAPLVIAEQFGTLASLYPGRIDLGVGRAPGTDPLTAQALRRARSESVDEFPRDLLELQSYFANVRPGQPIQAVPGAGLAVPIWLLGSSLFSAHLAASLGLPYAFASHFAPDQLLEALSIYRTHFEPSAALASPYAMACVNVFAADTDAEATRLFTSVQQQFLKLRRGTPGPLSPPVASLDGLGNPAELGRLNQALREAVVGAPAAVRRGLESFVERTQVDELMITAQIYDHEARLRSFAIAAEVLAKREPVPVP